jgi:zinc protease
MGTNGFEKTGEREGVSRYVMTSNGLEVLLREDRTAPIAAFLVLYRVGSRNEAVGYTGATHLLEHMMFKGTPKMNREKGNQIALTLEGIGADFNATTWYDRTNYFETVPSDKLELAVEIEADRMRNAIVADADRQSEMTVVRNELERGENDPLNVLDIQAHATAFREHPYHHPTIGWRADVEGVPTERLKAFYDTFYWPNNATVVVVGDFATDDALALVEKHFGQIPRAPHEIPAVYTAEPEQQGERRFVVRRSGPDGIVLLSFRAPEAAHPDSAALVVAQTILGSGRASRLYRDLVDTQLASDAAAGAEQFRDPGLFQLYARTMPGVSHETVERRMLDALQRLRDEPVGEEELAKAKRILRTRTVFGREGATNYVYEMSEAVSAVDWNWLFDAPEEVERVTAADVQRVARLYFRRGAMTAGWFIPGRDEADDFREPEEIDDEEAADERDEAVAAEPIGEPTDWSESVGEAAEEGVAPTAETDPSAISIPTGSTEADAGEATDFASRTLRVELSSGGGVLALERHADPTVAIRAQLRAGSFFAEGKHLLADMTARMLRRGTKRRDALQFAESIESLGAQIGESVGAFTVDVRAHALSEDTATILVAIAEMLRQPRFPASELEKVKAEIAAEIRHQQDSTSARAYERLSQLVLDPKHPYYRPSAEALFAELEATTIDDVRRFYESRYSGAALTIAVVGDIDAKAVASAAEQLFGDWTGERPEEIRFERTAPRSAGRETVRIADKANADVVIGLAAGLLRHDADYFPAMIANAALGQSTLSSRLGLRVRDTEGLTYGIASRFAGASLVDGLWFTTVTVQPANVERAIASTLDELERAVRDGITEKEVEHYKSNFAGSFKVGLATNAGIAARLVDAEFFGFGPGYLDEFPEHVAKVTTDEVNEALRRHVRLDALTTVVAGDLDEREPAEAG